MNLPPKYQIRTWHDKLGKQISFWVAICEAHYVQRILNGAERSSFVALSETPNTYVCDDCTTYNRRMKNETLPDVL